MTTSRVEIVKNNCWRGHKQYNHESPIPLLWNSDRPGRSPGWFGVNKDKSARALRNIELFDYLVQDAHLVHLINPTAYRRGRNVCSVVPLMFRHSVSYDFFGPGSQGFQLEMHQLCVTPNYSVSCQALYAMMHATDSGRELQVLVFFPFEFAQRIYFDMYLGVHGPDKSFMEAYASRLELQATLHRTTIHLDSYTYPQSRGVETREMKYTLTATPFKEMR